MDAETQLQLDQLQDLRVRHERRQHQLKLQAAELGRSTPPEVRTELEDIAGQISAIEKSITKLLIAQQHEVERAADAPGARSGESGEASWHPLWLYITRLEDSLRKDINGIYLFVEQRIGADGVVRDTRQRETDRYRRRVEGLLLAVLIVGVAVLFAVLLRS